MAYLSFRLLVVLSFLALAVLPQEGQAQVPDAQDRGYEAHRLQMELQRAGLLAAKDPEGKRIAFVKIVRRDVFEQGELWPDFVVWFNRFHWLTRTVVVQRELTFEKGGFFSQGAADETMRNLRSLGIFSLVRVLAVEGDSPQEVGVLVFTRDMWSLRLETEVSGAGTNVAARGQLTERNLFGNNTQAAVRFAYRPIALSVGQVVHDYRLFGERLELYESGDLFYNYRDGRPEGGVLSARMGRPFYQLRQRFAFDVTGSLRSAVHRDLDRNSEARVDLSGGDAQDCDPATVGCALSLYAERIAYVEAAAHYRIGQHYKQTFSLGFGVSRRFYRALAASQVDEAEAAEFARIVLPRSRTSVYPFVRYGLSIPRFAYFQNLGTFGTTESVQVGPRLDAVLSLPRAALGSTYDAFLAKGEMAMVWAGGDALLGLSAGAGARLEQGRVLDQTMSIQARGATPVLGMGRLVGLAKFVGRRRDSARTYVALGGDSGLRGYPSGYLRGYGAQLAVANVEYRTLPVEISSVHLGLVAFWDMGSVFSAGQRPSWRHGAGAGIRVLLPQLNSYAFRFDVGAPIGQGGFSLLLSYGGAQAVPLTALEDRLQESE